MPKVSDAVAQKVLALENLGRALEKKGYVPEEPFGQALSKIPNKNSRWQHLARSFLTENADRLRAVICKDGKPRAEVVTLAAVTAKLASYLAQQGGFDPDVAGPLSEVAVQYGLEVFCKGHVPPKRLTKKG